MAAKSTCRCQQGTARIILTWSFSNSQPLRTDLLIVKCPTLNFKTRFLGTSENRQPLDIHYVSEEHTFSCFGLHLHHTTIPGTTIHIR